MPEDVYGEDDVLLPQSDRLQILLPVEYELLWGLPQFSRSFRTVIVTCFLCCHHAKKDC